jgi:iron(III) transport system substrate-binding protein
MAMKRKTRAVSLVIAFTLCLPAFAGGASAVSEWERTLATAKKDGKVVVIGPAGTDVRDAFVQGFQKKHPEIQVEFSGMSGAQVTPKLLNEISAGLYRTDLVVGGATTALASLIPANAVVPMQPFLVGPESHDTSKWRGGKFDFSDNAEKYNLVYGNRVQIAFVYNRDLLSHGKIKSWKDFLDPQWKGKIAMLDPRRTGAGLGWARIWYATAGLGKDFLRQLFTTQDIFMLNEERQILDVVARGRYLVAIGPSGTQAFELKKKGLPIELFGSGALEEGGVVSASNNTLLVARNAPHPNVLKVYVDYLLSREGQYALSKASGVPSRRLDVPHDHIPDVLIPKDGVKYLEHYKEDFALAMSEQTIAFLNTILAR